MKSQSTSSASLKFASPEINAGSSSSKPKMLVGNAQMPKNKNMITPAPAKKRMPKRSKM